MTTDSVAAHLFRAICGIYVLKLRGTVVYVGQSRDVVQRVSSHRRRIEFDDVEIVPCDPADLLRKEVETIHSRRPLLNRAHSLSLEPKAPKSSKLNPMTPATFRARLGALGLSQVGFARAVSELSDEPLSHRSVQNWATGQRPIPQTVGAVLALMERRAALKAPQPPAEASAPLGHPVLPPSRPAPP